MTLVFKNQKPREPESWNNSILWVFLIVDFIVVVYFWVK